MISRVEFFAALCVTVLLIAASAWAEDEAPAAAEAPRTTETSRAGEKRLELDITSIRGNQELPRVMYIVPWKDPTIGNLVGKPVNSLVDEVLTPVDRDVFRRQTKYFDQLYGAPDAGTPRVAGAG